MKVKPQLQLQRWIALSCLLGLLSLSWPGHAATRAWLSRESIGLGETTTLNIETDQGDVSSPDYAALGADFDVSDNTSSRQYQNVNGQASQRMLFAVALRPHRSGAVQIPSIPVGRERTQLLSLLVDDKVQAPAAAHGGQVAFIETEVDARRPYVQQAVSYTTRLYYRLMIRGGTLQPDPRQPDGASLRELPDTADYTRQVGGEVYRVFERRYLLIPERAGPLRIPGMHFSGEVLLDPLDRIMGADDRVEARSAPLDIQVQPLPANAPQPWLPLHNLILGYLQPPREARAGEATTVVLQATADGAIAAQMPALELGKVKGAQVFANPVQLQERFVDGRPQVLARRTFSVVPTDAGELRIQPPPLHWWDADAGLERTASVAALSIRVRPGKASATPAPGLPSPGAERDNTSNETSLQSRAAMWAVLAALCALTALVLLGWWLARRTRPASGSDTGDVASTRKDAGAGLPGAGANDVAGSQGATRSHGSGPSRDAAAPTLQQALSGGDLATIAQAWCAAAQPAVRDLDELRCRLRDPAQLQALEQLQRARWGGGDSADTLAQLRMALRDGVCWRTQASGTDPLLAPLYPENAPKPPKSGSD